MSASAIEGSGGDKRRANTLVWLLTVVVNRGLGFARTILVARFLDPSAAGWGFLSISLGLGAQAFFETGTRQQVMTAGEADSEVLDSAFFTEAVKGLLLALALALASLVFSTNDATAGDVYWFAAFLPLLYGLTSPTLFAWERDQLHGRIALLTSSGALVGFAATGVLLAMGIGWAAVPVGFTVGQCAQVVASHVWARRLPRQFKIQRVGQLLRGGLPYTSIAIANYFMTVGLDQVLALRGAHADVAPHRLAFTVAMAGLGAVPGALARAALPADALRGRAGNTGPHLRTVIVSTLGSAALVPAVALAMPIIATWIYGDRWDGVSQLIPSVAAMVGVRSLSSPLTIQLVAGGRAGDESRVRMAEAIGTAAIYFALAGEGALAASWGGALVAVLALAARLVLFRAASYRGVSHVAWVTGVGAVVALGAPALAYCMLGSNGLSSTLVRLLVAAVATILSFVVLATLSRWVLRQQEMTE